MKPILRLLGYIVRHSPRTFAVAAFAGLASGATATGMVAIVNEALADPRPVSLVLLAIPFLVLVLLSPATRLVSQYLLIRLGQDLVYDLRLELTRRVLTTPLRHLERLGPHRLLVALTDDVTSITQSMVSFPEITSHGALVLGALVYMGLLSPSLFGIFLAAFALTILLYRFPLAAGFRRLKAAREEQDELYEHFRGATDGTKELKLHRDRRAGFLAALGRNADRLRRLLVSGNMILTAAIAGAWTFFFVAVGLVVFLGPTLGNVSRDALVGYALVLLFMRGPLQLVVSSLPTLARGGVAVEKIERLGLWLEEREREAEAVPGPPPPDWRRLELDGVVHHYRGEEGEAGFTVGPIDLVFEPGELVFLTGGNGSGKTTLAKLLLGLYLPDEGALRLDGEPVTRESADRYRQRFAAVFFDFHLFRGLLGLGGPDRDADAHQYLRRLELEDKVAVRDGELTTTALSQGQRKRLALLTAYLEDRPLYLFDEWAADQDPHFKEVFYRQLLPELKARGKTVIVISHDDRYYGLADRIVKLRDGRVVHDGPAAELDAAPVLEAVPG
ncbi:MAG TPA: cyclic peptide export ABC transporter [Thermoanaerobaculia bacterium]|nr:cyclic peptide export ABC transporter [Thermoanaerobaculia bacterium]